jgi:hypothetical protein
MRKGSEVKQAVTVTLQKTWAAARVKINLDELIVRFAGTGACMTKQAGHRGGLKVMVSLPDIADNAALSDSQVDEIVAMALHELGHAFFTDAGVWDKAVQRYAGDPLLHRCINAFEDVRMERAVIDSGYAAGSARLFPVLLQSLTAGCNKETFKHATNVAFAVCVDGRQYGTSVSHLIPATWADIVAQGVMRCAAQADTAAAVQNGIWLWEQTKRDHKKEIEEEKKKEQDGEAGEEVEGGGKPAKGRGDTGKRGERAIEPDIDVPLDECASITALEHVVDGQWETA